VRHPVLALPAMTRVLALPPEAIDVPAALVSDIRDEARTGAAQSLTRNKYMMYAHWSVVALRRGIGVPA
jgi:hypothetical protein